MSLPSGGGRALSPPEDDTAVPREDDERSAFTIEPRRPGLVERAREVRNYRWLVRFFGARAMEKVTRRTVLGRLWLVLRPLLDVGSRALIFGGLLAIPSQGLPYVVFLVGGMAAWSFFENSLVWATRSLELNRKLLRKIYVPRIIIPVASVVPALIELAAYLVILVGVIGFYGVRDGELYLNTGPELLAAVGALVLCATLALAIGFWTSVLGANVRDVRYSLLYVLGFWQYVTPVIYPLALVPDGYQTLAQINPMTPVVELFKWGLFDAGQVEPVALAGCGALVLVTMVSGLWFFGKAEAAAVDKL